MSWVTATARTTGDPITAAIWNQDVVDNTAALRAGGIAIASQAVGDVVSPDSATQFGRVAAVAVGQVLASAGVATKPVWTTTPIVNGVAFPATQAASGDANTLDDYEEGTWTPVLGGDGGTSGQTYSSQIGRYVKIGQFVWVTWYIVLTAKGTITGGLLLSGLPFTVENQGNLAIGRVKFNGLATNWITLDTRLLGNTTTATLEGSQAAATNDLLGPTTTDVANTTSCYGTLCYRAGA